ATAALSVPAPTRSTVSGTTLSGPIIGSAIRDAFLKLDPRQLMRNPVILSTEVVALLATASTVEAIGTGKPWLFAIQIAAWL
ncbi:hypothetical protein ABTN43_19880, partial [Acinetobacter baumannii]